MYFITTYSNGYLNTGHLKKPARERARRGVLAQPERSEQGGNKCHNPDFLGF